jgi:hypothetical protein
VARFSYINIPRSHLVMVDADTSPNQNTGLRLRTSLDSCRVEIHLVASLGNSRRVKNGGTGFKVKSYIDSTHLVSTSLNIKHQMRICQILTD